MTTMRLALPGRGVLTTTLGRWVMMVVATAHQEWRRRRDIAWLMNQHDRMLSDLGLSRGEIARVVRRGRDG